MTQLRQPLQSSLLTRLEPFQKLLDELEQTLQTLKLSAPTSDMANVFAFVVTRIKSATEESKHAEQLATIQEIARIYNRAPSTITDWANNYGSKWARKRGRVWLIETALFDAWYAANVTRLKARARKTIADASEDWPHAA